MGSFTRAQIRAALKAKIARKEPVILGGAGCGLVAKMEEAAGVDLILSYSSGFFRMDGHPSGSGWQPFGNGNDDTVSLGVRLMQAAKHTPVIAGVGPGDPRAGIPALIARMQEAGFSGITNVPTAGVYSNGFRRRLEAAGAGYRAEVELAWECDRRDFFTVMYAFTPEEASAMAAAGADIVSPHVRGTSGGSVGIENVLSIDEACERTQKMYEAAVAENPDVIVVCHGGPFSAPGDVKIAFERTDVQGFIGASSIERLPSEREIVRAVRSYMGMRLP